jgi:hypothetical protein
MEYLQASDVVATRLIAQKQECYYDEEWEGFYMNASEILEG